MCCFHPTYHPRQPSSPSGAAPVQRACAASRSAPRICAAAAAKGLTAPHRPPARQNRRVEEESVACSAGGRWRWLGRTHCCCCATVYATMHASSTLQPGAMQVADSSTSCLNPKFLTLISPGSEAPVGRIRGHPAVPAAAQLVSPRRKGSSAASGWSAAAAPFYPLHAHRHVSPATLSDAALTDAQHSQKRMAMLRWAACLSPWQPSHHQPQTTSCLQAGMQRTPPRQVLVCRHPSARPACWLSPGCTLAPACRTKGSGSRCHTIVAQLTPTKVCSEAVRLTTALLTSQSLMQGQVHVLQGGDPCQGVNGGCADPIRLQGCQPCAQQAGSVTETKARAGDIYWKEIFFASGHCRHHPD